MAVIRVSSPRERGEGRRSGGEWRFCLDNSCATAKQRCAGPAKIRRPESSPPRLEMFAFSAFTPRMGRPSARPRSNTSCNGLLSFGIASPVRRSFFAILLSAAISMSRRKIVTCMIRRFGVAPSCVRRTSAPLFAHSNRSAFATRCAFITLMRGYLVGGIIGCCRSKKIAVFASMKFWQVTH